MRFAKWHALGNDYLIVERADVARALDAAIVRRLCDPHRGIGADGLLEVVAVDGPRAELLIWNPDGSTAELSGNGTRIAARWLARLLGVDEVVVTVGARAVTSRMRAAPLVEQDLGPVVVSPSEQLDVLGETVEVTPVSVGNPHAVLRREPERSELLRLGPALETHPRFADRTNVQLVRTDGPNELTVVVWERGVGETLASGTSACAAAAAAVANGWCDSPVTVRLPGGELHVSLDAEGRVRLTGPAEEICTGEVAEELLAGVEAHTATP